MGSDREPHPPRLPQKRLSVPLINHGDDAAILPRLTGGVQSARLPDLQPNVLYECLPTYLHYVEVTFASIHQTFVRARRVSLLLGQSRSRQFSFPIVHRLKR